MLQKQIFVLSSLFLLLVFFGCQGITSDRSFSYTVGGCQQIRAIPEIPKSAESGEVRAYWSGDSIVIEHNLTYVCCANITLTENVSGDRIIITETNVGEMCRCICTYYVSATFKGLEKKRYTIELRAVDQVGEIVVDPAESCVTDADCVPAQCCHATSCTNKEFAPDCTGVACTLECRIGTLDCGGDCYCMNNRCAARLIAAGVPR